LLSAKTGNGSNRQADDFVPGNQPQLAALSQVRNQAAHCRTDMRSAKTRCRKMLEPEMKKIQTIAVALVLAAGTIAPAVAAPICLTSYLIDRTKVIDSRTLDFHMKNGTVYRNTLRAECIGLKFNGFAYDTRSGSICDNMQTIRLLDSGQVCTLGAFTKLPPAPHSKI
jgi:hypothetical protein